MDKLKLILGIAQAGAGALLPPAWLPIANLIGHGIDEIFAQVDAERQRRGLSWQDLEAQLGAEMTSEKTKWTDFIARLENDGK